MRVASYQDLRVRTFSHLGEPADNIAPVMELRFRNALGRNFRKAWIYPGAQWPFAIEVKQLSLEADRWAGIAAKGDVISVHDKDPRTDLTNKRIPWFLEDAEAGRRIFVAGSVSPVWVNYRRWEPSFDWGDFNEDKTYTAWDCAWKDGELQRMENSVWTSVPIPYIFKEFLAFYCAADLLTDAGDARREKWRSDGDAALAQEAANLRAERQKTPIAETP